MSDILQCYKFIFTYKKDQNLGAADVILTEEEFKNIEQELDKITIYGNRTDEDIQKMGYVKAQ